MTLTSPLGVIQQADAIESPAKSVFLAFINCKRLDASLYSFINSFHTEIKLRLKVNHDMNSLAFTPVHNILINHGQVVNHIALVRFD